MNKSKYFVLTAVIAIVTLLIVGSSVISAQANSLVIGTPLPTTLPNSTTQVEGNAPSAKEQAELKEIVRSFIEVRYQALSISDGDNYQRNGFGNMVAKTPKATDFLRQEEGKLAVEIKHAELDHLRYTDYEVFLNFGGVMVDAANQNAQIAVTEGNEVIYEISAELNPDNPIVSHTAGIQHTIVLHKEYGTWKIVSDTYNDDLWKMLRMKGVTADEIVQVAEEMISTMKSTPRPAPNATIPESSTASNLSDDPSSHTYDRAGAVEYAINHWSQYNPDYFSFEKDCQNFVSQAIYEGGNASMSIPSPVPPPSYDTYGQWYYLNLYQRATAWAGVDQFYNFVTQPNSWDEGPEGNFVSDPSQLDLGDVIQYDWDNNGYWDHSVIVVDKEGGIPYVESHTDNLDRVPYFKLEPNNLDKKMRYIHIERSDGYPPVKATITLGSDDAGTVTNLTTGNCSYTGTGIPAGDYDIYFGRCFSTGANITSGFQFRNIEIPLGAHLKYAYITFTEDGPYTVPLTLEINGENTGNPDPYTEANPPENRLQNLTGKPVQWPITSNWAIGQRVTTPNLSSFIDEIVNHGQWWNFENTLSIIFTNLTPSGNPTPVRRVIGYERAIGDHAYGPLFPAKLIATYTMEGSGSTAPRVYSVTRKTASPTNAASVEFEVKFSEPVIGVDTTSPFNDFSPLHTDGVTGAFITAVNGSGDTYTVTVNTGSGDGKIRLDVFAPDGLDPDPIRSSTTGESLGGGFNTGESYTIDKTVPFVASIFLTSPNPNGTNAPSVDFEVYFNEPVVGVDTEGPTFDGFSLVSEIADASITSVTKISGNRYKVTVNTGSSTGSGDKSIKLKVTGTGAIRDYASNLFVEPHESDPYVIHKVTVQSSLPETTNPTNASAVNFTVTFSEPVTGVDVSDFALTTMGVSGAAITDVSGSGSAYTVTVNTGTGDGTIRLDILANGTILNASLISVNVGFTTGEISTIDKTPPTVLSITRSSPNPTVCNTYVYFTVTFSESVTGVDISDFTLTNHGAAIAQIVEVAGSGSVYSVKVYTGAGCGNGNFKLNLIDNDSIADTAGNKLGGVGAGNGSFTKGETYKINKK